MVGFVRVAAGYFVCTAAADRLPGEPGLSGYTYETYLAEFGKERSYQVAASLASIAPASRAEVFAENLAAIKEHNADETKTWFAAPNEYTDWTHEEFTMWRTRGTLPTPPGGSALSASSLARPVGSLPDSVDYRTHKGVLTDVKNQGGCGSCWAFSAVETFESHLALATKKAAPVLSEQQVVSCSKNPKKCGGTGGCQGSTQQLAFNYTKQAGLSLESSYGYQGVTGTCQASKIHPVAKNTGYVQVAQNNYTEMMNALVNAGPVAITIAAGGMGWQLYGGGIYSGGLFGPKSCGFAVDHGVVMVGYGTQGAKDYWIIRNSWGPGWGEKGYMRLQRFGEGKEPCGVDQSPGDGIACAGDTKKPTYCGICGLLSSSSYPTGLHVVTEGVAPASEIVI